MKITEQTLEQEIAPLLAKWLAGQIITQPAVGRKKPDVILTWGAYRLVIELEIGSPRKMLEAVAQAHGYATQLQADGIIGLVYPESARRTIHTRQDVVDIVQQTPVSVLILSPFLSRHFTDILPQAWAEKIKPLMEQARQPIVDIDLVTRVLRDAVETLAWKLRQRYKVANPALEVVINRFELFEALSSSSEKATRTTKRDLTAAACDLTAYIFVNQILLYQLLRQSLQLPPLPPLHDFADLRQHFGHVTAINYRAVYSVDVIGSLPASAKPEVNKIILALQAIRSECAPHDLLGRIFHEFLPFETRKLLATFYTKPVAAELLAALAIDRADAVVLDPACGSGTLLVSAYRHKRALAPRRARETVRHKEIYGIDVMPFAAHLAALNLTLQDINQVTDDVCVGVGNSLNFTPGANIPTQLHLLPTAQAQAKINSPHTLPGFTLPQAVDLVIMNPPYTDRKRLTPGMLGGQADAFTQPQNYWAYFIKMADDLLREGGRIAAVLPRLFVAGAFSREVREWLFKQENYTLRYLVRACREIAFSETASFRDFLVVLDKGKTNHPCAIVYLKTSLGDLSLEEAGELARRIKQTPEGRPYSDAEIEISWSKPQAIREGADNLWFLAGLENATNARVLRDFYQQLLERAENLLGPLGEQRFVSIKRGLEPRPVGMYNALFLVRPLELKRVERSSLIITKETALKTLVALRGTEYSFNVPNNAIALGLKTASYMPCWRIDEHADRVIIKRFDGFSNIETFFSKIDFGYIDSFAQSRYTHLLVTKRINLAAPGTCALAFYADRCMISANVLYSVVASPAYSKALCLCLISHDIVHCF